MHESKNSSNFKGFAEIKADKILLDKTIQKVLSSKKSKVGFMQKYGYKRTLAMAASFVLVISAISVYFLKPDSSTNNDVPGRSVVDNTAENQEPKGITPETTEKGLFIPAIQLPKKSKGIAMDMIGLVVYNSKIYTQTGTSIEANNALALLGDKLGTAKGNIDEWSSQDEYATEFASTIGPEDIYTVKGYDKDFRLMTYTVYDGRIYAQFYECLNGITIQNGKDVFGKLNIEGNINNAYYRSYDDWNNSINNFHVIGDAELYNEFVKELNNSVPHSYESVDVESLRHQDSYKEVTLELKDGSRVSMALYKNGYIRYGYLNIYFKMEHEVFQRLWDELAL